MLFIQMMLFLFNLILRGELALANYPSITEARDIKLFKKRAIWKIVLKNRIQNLSPEFSECTESVHFWLADGWALGTDACSSKHKSWELSIRRVYLFCSLCYTTNVHMPAEADDLWNKLAILPTRWKQMAGCAAPYIVCLNIMALNATQKVLCDWSPDRLILLLN